MKNEIPISLFPLGEIVETRGAQKAIPSAVKKIALNRHRAGDWGELYDEDKAANDAAMKNGGRILSCYESGADKFWVITEKERDRTVILLPSEY